MSIYIMFIPSFSHLINMDHVNILKSEVSLIPVQLFFIPTDQVLLMYRSKIKCHSLCFNGFMLHTVHVTCKKACWLRRLNCINSNGLKKKNRKRNQGYHSYRFVACDALIKAGYDILIEITTSSIKLIGGARHKHRAGMRW